jgi:hypothetical protein
LALGIVAQPASIKILAQIFVQTVSIAWGIRIASYTSKGWLLKTNTMNSDETYQGATHAILLFNCVPLYDALLASIRYFIASTSTY